VIFVRIGKRTCWVIFWLGEIARRSAIFFLTSNGFAGRHILPPMLTIFLNLMLGSEENSAGVVLHIKVKQHSSFWQSRFQNQSFYKCASTRINRPGSKPTLWKDNILIRTLNDSNHAGIFSRRYLYGKMDKNRGMNLHLIISNLLPVLYLPSFP
jgi:hypothetical protein